MGARRGVAGHAGRALMSALDMPWLVWRCLLWVGWGTTTLVPARVRLRHGPWVDVMLP